MAEYGIVMTEFIVGITKRIDTIYALIICAG